MTTEQTTEKHRGWKLLADGIDEPLATALSNYMMAVSGRRPTRDEMWDIYWAAVDAIEKAAKNG